MKNTLAKCNEDAYLPSLHLSTVELRCKLQEKLNRVTWPLEQTRRPRILYFLYVKLASCIGHVLCKSRPILFHINGRNLLEKL